MMLFSLRAPNDAGGYDRASYHYYADKVFVIDSGGVWYAGEIGSVCKHAIHVDSKFDSFEFEWSRDKQFIRKIAKAGTDVQFTEGTRNTSVNTTSAHKSSTGGGSSRYGGSCGFATAHQGSQGYGRGGSNYSSRRALYKTAGSSEIYDDIKEPILDDIQ